MCNNNINMEKKNSLIKFIETNNLPYELILINNKKREGQKDEKIPSGLYCGIKDRSKLINKYKDKYNKSTKICYKIDLSNSEFSVADIDDDSSLEYIYECYPFLKNTFYLKGNNIGYHFYIKNDIFKNASKIIKKMNFKQQIKGDLITDFIWEDIKKEIFNCDNIINIKKEEIIDMFPTFKSVEEKELDIENKSVKKNINNNNIAIFHGNKDELEEIVENIPKRYSDSYEDWIKILSILKKYNFYDMAKLFSKKSKKYNENNFDEYYYNRTFQWDYDTGTLFQYSKENKTNFNKIKGYYLKNQIQKQNDFSYKTVCDNFEKLHFKVINKSIYGKYQNNKLMTFTKQKLCETYSHLYYEVKKINKKGEEITEDCSFINKYTGVNKTIRLYEEMNVYPNQKLCPTDHFNLWFPFHLELVDKYDYDQDGLDFVLNHIKMLCKYEETVYEYLLDYFAHLFQYPYEKSDIFVLFVGLQGSGKSMLVELLGNMVGSEKYLETSNPTRDVWGNHNSPMTNSYLVNFEELDFLQQKGSEGIFKNIITGKTMVINPKGKDQFIINSYHRFIGSTNNHDCPIRTSNDDRRNLIINVCNEKKNNKEYFSKFHTLINSKNLQKTFYDYLMKRKNIDIFKSKKVPHTDYQNELKESFEDLVLTFVKKQVFKNTEVSQELDNNNNYIILEKIEKINSSKLFSKLNEFLEKEKSKCDFTHKRFALKIMNLGLNGIVKKRNNAGVQFEFNYKLLCNELDITFEKEECLIIDSDSD